MAFSLGDSAISLYIDSVFSKRVCRPSKFNTPIPPWLCISIANEGFTTASMDEAKNGIFILTFSKSTEISTNSGFIVISPGAIETSSNPYAGCNVFKSFRKSYLLWGIRLNVQIINSFDVITERALIDLSVYVRIY